MSAYYILHNFDPTKKHHKYEKAESSKKTTRDLSCLLSLIKRV